MEKPDRLSEGNAPPKVEEWKVGLATIGIIAACLLVCFVIYLILKRIYKKVYEMTAERYRVIDLAKSKRFTTIRTPTNT